MAEVIKEKISENLGRIIAKHKTRFIKVEKTTRKTEYFCVEGEELLTFFVKDTKSAEKEIRQNPSIFTFKEFASAL